MLLTVMKANLSEGLLSVDTVRLLAANLGFAALLFGGVPNICHPPQFHLSIFYTFPPQYIRYFTL